MPQFGEIGDDLRADESAAADNQNLHDPPSPIPSRPSRWGSPILLVFRNG
jgi:hypothetical protein